MTFSNTQFQALTAICDTFIGANHSTGDPTGYWARSASDQGVPARILELIQGIKAEDQAAFLQLLQLIGSPVLGLTWGGPLKPAHRLTVAQRERLLGSWSSSRFALLRNAYTTLRKATTFLYFGDIPTGKKDNPNHAALGYQLPDLAPVVDPAPLPVLTLTKDTTLDCDFLVIGSGSGGGVIAAQLAAAGHAVLVVEKGIYTPRHALTMQEFPMLNAHFEAGALLATQTGSVAIMAGSTLGGGSAINWAAALRTPDYVLEEWGNDFENPHFTTPEYQQCFEHIEARNGIGHDFGHNPQNQLLLTAGKQLGWRTEAIPMNMRVPQGVSKEQAWQAAGFSCLGDAHGIKQGVQETFLRDAVRDGARILPNTRIDKITIQNGLATGATGVYHLPDGSPVQVQVRARKVVVSAGALHTPVLLLKSGLRHPQIGRNLFLHPVIPTAGFYGEDISPWYGPMMSVIIKEFEQLNGNFGHRLECPPVHPGLAAQALSWTNSAMMKTDLLQMRRLAVHVCLVRDKFGGRVTVGKQSGQPVLHYEVHPFDRAHLIHAMQRSAEAHAAAGAERIAILHNQPIDFYPGKGGDLAAFQAQIAQKNWSNNYSGVFSAHQMGTCRMGGRKDCPVQPDGQTREVKGLYVADTSLFPSASGSNPMLSVQALAFYLGQGMG